MTTELHLLGWTLVLAIVQILLPSQFRNKETGTAYNTGPRDDPGPPVGVITGRLQRAQKNLFETLPIFAAAILIAHMAGRDGALTLCGAWLYFIGRVVYVPLYTAGISYVRSAVWVVSLLGLILVLIADLRPF
jgi:uncharacterized MAPEG superfamily protein